MHKMCNWRLGHDWWMADWRSELQTSSVCVMRSLNAIWEPTPLPQNLWLTHIRNWLLVYSCSAVCLGSYGFEWHVGRVIERLVDLRGLCCFFGDKWDWDVCHSLHVIRIRYNVPFHETHSQYGKVCHTQRRYVVPRGTRERTPLFTSKWNRNEEVPTRWANIWHTKSAKTKTFTGTVVLIFKRFVFHLSIRYVLRVRIELIITRRRCI